MDATSTWKVGPAGQTIQGVRMPAIGPALSPALIAEQVDAIIGAASSGVSLKVIDKITGAGIVQFSPANTSKKLSTYDDKGLYFRDAPSDILQGGVLADVIAGDGNKNVAIINRNDAYGVGLTEDMTAALTAAGSGSSDAGCFGRKCSSSCTRLGTSPRSVSVGKSR